MASATPDLRLPSQPQGITAGTKLCCSVTKAHVCEQHFLLLESGTVEIRTSNVMSRKCNSLTTTPPRHNQRSAVHCSGFWGHVFGERLSDNAVATVDVYTDPRLCVRPTQSTHPRHIVSPRPSSLPPPFSPALKCPVAGRIIRRPVERRDKDS